jgi:TPR repeat protein
MRGPAHPASWFLRTAALGALSLAAALLAAPRALAADDATVSRLLRGFDELVFRIDGAGLVGTRKWRTGLRVQIVGTPEDGAEAMAMEAVARAASLAGLAMARVAADGNFVLRFERTSAYVVDGRMAACYATTRADGSGALVLAQLFINQGHADLRTCIVHEVMHGFGFPGHPHALDTVMSYTHRRDAFTELDIAAFRALYDPRMRTNAYYLPGLIVARQIIAEQTGAVAPGASSAHLAHEPLDRALAHLTAEADRGNAYAQRQLGLAHYVGQVVARDDARAVAWWRRAGDGGDTEARYLLGEAALAGRGGPRDAHAAQEHHLAAAARGHVLAMMRAARALEQGSGGTPDRLGAAIWYLVAAQHGHAPARQEGERILALLAPSEQDDARRRARLWHSIR